MNTRLGFNFSLATTWCGGTGIVCIEFLLITTVSWKTIYFIYMYMTLMLRLHQEIYFVKRRQYYFSSKYVNNWYTNALGITISHQPVYKSMTNRTSRMGDNSIMYCKFNSVLCAITIKPGPQDVLIRDNRRTVKWN